MESIVSKRGLSGQKAFSSRVLFRASARGPSTHSEFLNDIDAAKVAISKQTKRNISSVKQIDSIATDTARKGVLGQSFDELKKLENNITKLSAQLGSAVGDQRQAIEKEIAASTDAYNRISGSEELTRAKQLLTEVQKKLRVTESKQERSSIISSLDSYKDLFGEDIINFLKSGSDADVDSFITGTTSLLDTKLTTAARNVGVFSITTGQALSEAGDPVKFAEQRRNNIEATKNPGSLTTVIALRFDTDENIRASSNLVDQLDKKISSLINFVSKSNVADESGELDEFKEKDDPNKAKSLDPRILVGEIADNLSTANMLAIASNLDRERVKKLLY